MKTLVSFPSITVSEFEEACQAINTRFDLCGHLQNDWSRVDLVKQDVVHLRITRILHQTTKRAHSNIDEAEDEVHEEDEEALQSRSPSESGIRIEYQVFLSPIYRVPVLYLNLEDRRGVVPPTIESLYEQVIPEHFKAQVRDLGVIGGITMADHPITNRPVFFVHPCNTADALRASLEETKITADQYILLWIGIVGGCVGLQVPTAIAIARTNGTHGKSNAS
ncbi:uncharacterized protein BDZ99DRAFT_415968 [Mytilinidion resinicola]|uniref:Ubiquitin-like-conjugating enzyme ATG10 n=1 Tax=Mytilinidion resinicola TaxID=574789 RepID=A0A6A6YMF0_9PEZI|nr:uncharacterized protein BDZ99DRAFT_415968 [Mytilinidion resinicola]KAF2809970.1 hypothetical protein BDZ99DRAFT_415968 [Mytilinidion resinicola]